MQIKAKTEIFCSCGHLVVKFRNDVNDIFEISSDDFSIDGGNVTDNGYKCERCNDEIATMTNAKWKIKNIN
jgi:DNA-directed RNA polymerase subunit RPC12/RpoP